MVTKVCSKCGTEKPLDEFGKTKTYSFKQKKELIKQNARCKSCKNIYQKHWFYENYEEQSKKARERWKKYSITHQEQIKGKRKNYKPKKLTKSERRKRRDALWEKRHKEFCILVEEKKSVIDKIIKNIHQEKRAKQKKYKYYPHDKEKKKHYNKIYQERIVKEVSDNYARYRLASNRIFDIKDVPNELVKLYQIHVKIKRFLKGQEDGQKDIKGHERVA